MPPAARILDNHMCPMHGGGPTLTGELTVLIGYQPAARVTDKLVCVGPPDVVVSGETTVLIGNLPAARLGDPTVHGGRIMQGCFTVNIGSSPQAETLKTDEPFCEECERRRQEREAARKRGKR
jgi:uncharacterized Zn-binding protein involved in type VI secretion